MSTSVFKIRRKSDGLFSSGGCYPKWSEYGKAWATLRRARLAASLLNEDWCQKTHGYQDCEIVEYELRSIAIETIQIVEGEAVWTARGGPKS